MIHIVFFRWAFIVSLWFRCFDLLGRVPRFLPRNSRPSSGELSDLRFIPSNLSDQACRSSDTISSIAACRVVNVLVRDGLMLWLWLCDLLKVRGWLNNVWLCLRSHYNTYQWPFVLSQQTSSISVIMVVDVMYYLWWYFSQYLVVFTAGKGRMVLCLLFNPLFAATAVLFRPNMLPLRFIWWVLGGWCCCWCGLLFMVIFQPIFGGFHCWRRENGALPFV